MTPASMTRLPRSRSQRSASCPPAVPPTSCARVRGAEHDGRGDARTAPRLHPRSGDQAQDGRQGGAHAQAHEDAQDRGHGEQLSDRESRDHHGSDERHAQGDLPLELLLRHEHAGHACGDHCRVQQHRRPGGEALFAGERVDVRHGGRIEEGCDAVGARDGEAQCRGGQHRQPRTDLHDEDAHDISPGTTRRWAGALRLCGLRCGRGGRRGSDVVHRPHLTRGH